MVWSFLQLAQVLGRDIAGFDWGIFGPLLAHRSLYGLLSPLYGANRMRIFNYLPDSPGVVPLNDFF